jgi:hypothetical protein
MSCLFSNTRGQYLALYVPLIPYLSMVVQIVVLFLFTITVLCTLLEKAFFQQKFWKENPVSSGIYHEWLKLLPLLLLAPLWNHLQMLTFYNTHSNIFVTTPIYLWLSSAIKHYDRSIQIKSLITVIINVYKL